MKKTKKFKEMIRMYLTSGHWKNSEVDSYFLWRQTCTI